MAQYYCELAEHARSRKDADAARRHLAEAFGCEPQCVRGLMISARMALDSGDPVSAAVALEQVVEKDIEFVPEILGPVLSCYEQLGERHRAREFLRMLTDRYEGISPVIALARMIEDEDGGPAAAAYLAEQLRSRPSIRGLMHLIALSLKTAQGGDREPLAILDELVRKLVEGKAVYRCTRCGFGARAHHWQCPSCKTWGSVKPIHGVAGD
jgi:lipopolysaccharide biosynthesis regulator YciM